MADVSLFGRNNMLLCNSFRLILLFVVLRTTDCERKIKDGHTVDTTPNYMVYLTKAQQSPTFYDAWVCGGAIVTTQFIITSAACVEDVQYMYAIAGYKHYVKAKDIATNACTKAMRKKIIYTCVPKSYDFAYEKIQKWAFIDIAAVKVESPYDFSAQKLDACDWVPGKIDINYDIKRQVPNTDAMVLGWGHTHKWRKPGDSKDYNQETLQYSSILLMDKEECKKLYASTPDLLSIIDKYMICAMNEGNINEKGDLITKSIPTADGCVGTAVRVGGECQEPVQETLKPEQDKRPTQRPQPFRWDSNTNANPYAYILGQQQNQGYNNWNSNNYGFDPYANVNQNPSAVDNDDITFDDIMSNFRRQDRNMTANTTSYNYTRKAGICQNDHGGPLVTWVGKHEVLLGVASVFRLNKDLDCVGPYLFTSTQCNGAFLNCVINSDMDEVETKPTTTQFTTTQPTTTQFTTTQPTTTQPTTTQPTTTQPTTTQLTTTQPTTTQPTTTQPTTTQPTTTKLTTRKHKKKTRTTTQSMTPEDSEEDESTSENMIPETTTTPYDPNREDDYPTSQSTIQETTTYTFPPEDEDDGVGTLSSHPNRFKIKDNGHDIVNDRNYYDYGYYYDYSSLPPPLSEETLQDPNNVKRLSGSPNKDETFGFYVRRSSDYCNLLNVKNRFDVVERRISWRNHPDGPAANELLEDLFENE